MSDETRQTDMALLQGCLAGDPEAAEAFVRRFSNLVYSAVRQTLIRKGVWYRTQDLEGFHNSVFLSLFENRCKKLRQFQGKNGCSVATWVRTVAVRLMLNQLRKQGMDSVAGQKQRISLDALAEMRDAGPDPGQVREKTEQQELIARAMETLPARDRLLLKLHFEQALSLPQVAAAMGISVQNAYTIKHRAIGRLKERVWALM